MPTVQRNGATMFYEEAGTGDASIVLVHGLGKHEHYARQIEHFSKTHRVIAPDLPGFGRSAVTDREYTLPAFADDIAWLCDELELRDPVIAGHSMSGGVAVEVAAKRPELPAAIVLLDPVPIVTAPIFHQLMTPFVEALNGPDYRTALREFAEALMFRPTDDQHVRTQVIDDLCAAPQQVIAGAIGSLLVWNAEEASRRVRVPVLLITAGDGIPTDMPRTREVIPQVELGRTVGAGHFAHLLAPDQVNAMIEQFLAVSTVATAAA